MRKGMRGLISRFAADRDPRRPRRARAAVPVGAGPGRPAGAAAEVGVARVREARGARREASRGGDEDPGHLVVGLAELLRARRQRPRQAARPRASTFGRASRARDGPALAGVSFNTRSRRARSPCPPACGARSAPASILKATSLEQPPSPATSARPPGTPATGSAAGAGRCRSRHRARRRAGDHSRPFRRPRLSLSLSARRPPPLGA